MPLPFRRSVQDSVYISHVSLEFCIPARLVFIDVITLIVSGNCEAPHAILSSLPSVLVGLCMYVCMYVCVRGGPNQPLHRDPQWSIVLVGLSNHSLNPCGGGVEYLHREPASRKRRRNGTKKGRAIA
jgi:hypothetical protein